MSPRAIAAFEALTDEQVVERVRSGETALFEVLMRRHNARLYRAARSVLRDEQDVEDVMQQAYVNAYTHLDQFAGRARFSTWLTRIAIHEALGRARRQGTLMETAIGDAEGREDREETMASGDPTPEHHAFSAELRALLEDAIDALPAGYREVFMLREVEGMSTAEVVEALELSEEAVKTRLHRARGLLRDHLYASTGAAAPQAFQFHATRCDRVVERVVEEVFKTIGGGRTGTVASG
ncbi:MAG: RNA polymerase sigma factor [Acidobacteria bacterium]|nr:MAG: RNA polymerase sigma factor [Acidobacteriota bacterium]